MVFEQEYLLPVSVKKVSSDFRIEKCSMLQFSILKTAHRLSKRSQFAICTVSLS
jgi:hypothetical protein